MASLPNDVARTTRRPSGQPCWQQRQDGDYAPGVLLWWRHQAKRTAAPSKPAQRQSRGGPRYLAASLNNAWAKARTCTVVAYHPCFATRLGGVSGGKETQGSRDSSHTAMAGAG